MKLDAYVYELTDADLASRPPVECILDRAICNVWQKGGTYNVFSLRNSVEFLPPPLHIKLGVVHKVLALLDLVVKQLEMKHDMDTTR